MSLESISQLLTIVLLIVTAMVGGIIALRLKLPVLVGYIASGIVFGTFFLPFVDPRLLSVIADIGVTLLLFTLGVEFSFHRLSKIFPSVAWVTMLQLLLSFLVFLGVLLLAGLSFFAAVFIAVAASLSSTAVVVKVLSEKGELETVPGQVMTGYLIVQDLAVVPIMVILPAIVRASMGESVTPGVVAMAVGSSLLYAVILLVGFLVIGKWAIPRSIAAVTKLHSRELLLLATIGIVLTAAVCAYFFGLSAALGAFIAGLLISDTSQNHAIFAEIRPMRDVFAVVFFVSLGLSIPISVLMGQLPMVVAFAAIVMLTKASIVYVLTRFLGHHAKTAFIVSIGLTQISEFGFILAQEAMRLSVISSSQYVFLVGTAFLTICLSAPAIASANKWYYGPVRILLEKVIFRNKKIKPVDDEGPKYTNHIIVCGYGRVGKYVGRALEIANIPYVVVDYDQATVQSLRERGVPVLFGDPADRDILHLAAIEQAKAVVIAIPDRHTQELIISHALTLNKGIVLFCRVHHEEDQRWLKSLGVHTLVQPEFEAAVTIVHKVFSMHKIDKDDAIKKIARLKIEHGLG